MVLRFLKRYKFFLTSLALTIIILMVSSEMGWKIMGTAEDSFLQMIEVLPPIMIMLGLMDEWISRERMMKYMGKGSGPLGVFLSIFIGSVGAGPMYAAFPFTEVLLKKGVRFSNIIIFMNAWCVTKISTVLFEITSLGYMFTFLRFAINLPGIIIMGYIVERFIHDDEVTSLCKNL